jgi:hypothetical protein
VIRAMSDLEELIKRIKALVAEIEGPEDLIEAVWPSRDDKKEWLLISIAEAMLAILHDLREKADQ